MHFSEIRQQAGTDRSIVGSCGSLKCEQWYQWKNKRPNTLDVRDTLVPRVMVVIWWHTFMFFFQAFTFQGSLEGKKISSTILRVIFGKEQMIFLLSSLHGSEQFDFQVCLDLEFFTMRSSSHHQPLTYSSSLSSLKSQYMPFSEMKIIDVAVSSKWLETSICVFTNTQYTAQHNFTRLDRGRHTAGVIFSSWNFIV